MPVNMNNKSIHAFLAGVIVTTAVVGIEANGQPASGQAIQEASNSVRSRAASQRVSPAPMPTIGRPAPEVNPDAPITLNSLHRDSVGFVTLTWTLTYNGSDQIFGVPRDFVSVYKYASTSASAITLTDEVGKIRYNPLRMDPSGTCMCTDMPSIPLGLHDGQSAVLTETYELPENVKSVTVSIPDYSSVKNVPVN